MTHPNDPSLTTSSAAPPLTVMTVNIHKGFTVFNRKFILHDLREAVRSVQKAPAAATGVEADAADEIRIDTASGEQDKEETHATCAWCLTHALDAGLAHAAACPQPPPTEPRMAVPRGVASFTAQQVRGPFAARDSPPAQWA